MLRRLGNGPAAVQAKLEVGAADDPLEHEADRAADAVMRSPGCPGTGLVQRACACPACTQAAEDTLRLKRTAGAAPGQAEAPPQVHQALQAQGRPLDPATRAFFEPRFGCDFAPVRVHTDSLAAASARAIGARAYTHGSRIAFAEGQFAPATEAGRRLLAHELAHVVQQGGGATATLRRDTFTPSSAQAVVVKESKTTNEVKESVKTYCYEILRNAGLDPDAWYSNFTSTKFLGIDVPNVHQEMADHLKAKELEFRAKYGDDEHTRWKLGLLDKTWAGGREFPSSAPVSMHLFGLAVDVNYNENPFIGTSANDVFARAGIMSDGTPRAYSDGMSFDDLEKLNNVLIDYFHYLDWNDLGGRLKELGDKAPPLFKGKTSAEVEKLIEKDLATLGTKWERPGAKNKIRDFGFMLLRKEFKEGIGLAWGGSYGDMMHFDMRNANGKGQHGAAIQGAIGAYLAKKKAEAKKVEADDGHGGEKKT